MAVENKYVDANVAAGKMQKSALCVGEIEKCVVALAAIAAADDDGSVYRLAVGLDGNTIITGIEVYNDAITGGTDYDLGFYNAELGAVADKDTLADGMDLSTGHATGSALNGASAIAFANMKKTINELLGLTDATRKMRYDLALTANACGTAAGNVLVRVRYIQG